MQDMNQVYRNVCCMCCGIPQVSKNYFKKLDGTLVRYTQDHVFLRSLGGSNCIDNLVPMCYDCNQLRGNLFAELTEFLEWYWSGEPLPVSKNFSYLTKPKKITKEDYNWIPKLGSNTISVPVKVVYLNGVAYQEYKHPTFGTSLIKIEVLKDDRVAC